MLCRLAAAALLAAALPLTVQAALKSSHAQDQDHAPVAKRLPAAWYQADNHPAHALFKRQSDGSTYPTVGSQEWYNAYPPGLPDTSKLPTEWVNALNAAVTAGKIPNIPPSHNAPNQDPTYPNGLDPNSAKVCSGTYQCRIPGDIWDAPEGYLGCGFGEILCLPNFQQLTYFERRWASPYLGQAVPVPPAKQSTRHSLKHNSNFWPNMIDIF